MNTENDVIIRPAVISDLPALLDIYNAEVTGSFSTFDTEPKSLGEREKWFYAHQGGRYILLTAEFGGAAVGYASLSPYRPLDAYKGTVELSIYVRADMRRRGIAGMLMGEILRMAEENPEINTVVSVITSGNEASKRLHERFGFTFCGTMPDVGEKNGVSLGIDNFVLSVR